jgi:hypothetical protein
MASVNIFKDVRRLKIALIARAQKRGITEDYGQREYRQLKDKYAAYMGRFSAETDAALNAELQKFFEWCINYTGKNEEVV